MNANSPVSRGSSAPRRRSAAVRLSGNGAVASSRGGPLSTAQATTPAPATNATTTRHPTIPTPTKDLIAVDIQP